MLRILSWPEIASLSMGTIYHLFPKTEFLWLMQEALIIICLRRGISTIIKTTIQSVDLWFELGVCKSCIVWSREINPWKVGFFHLTFIPNESRFRTIWLIDKEKEGEVNKCALNTIFHILIVYLHSIPLSLMLFSLYCQWIYRFTEFK